MNWLRLVCDWYLSLRIVRYPVLGCLGVWLCNRYETRRYRTSVEDNLAMRGVPFTSGPFAPGGVFNIEYAPYTLPPKRYNKSWWGLDGNFQRLLAKTRELAGREYKYAVTINGQYIRNKDDSPKGFSSYREAECFTFVVDDFKGVHYGYIDDRRTKTYVVPYPYPEAGKTSND